MTRERGSISLTVAMGSMILCTLALAAADLGALFVTRARAQAAADAAVLAAAMRQAPVLGVTGEPEEAARESAEVNGAALVKCECRVGEAESFVEVEIPARIGFVRGWRGRIVRAHARAEIDPDVFSYRDPG